MITDEEARQASAEGQNGGEEGADDTENARNSEDVQDECE